MNFWQTRKIYPAITTTDRSDWREKIEELKSLPIAEAAVFPTVLELEERQELYRSLESTPLERVPFVHLRTDMSADEIRYFLERWKTEIFNLHPFVTEPLPPAFREFKDLIYIENNNSVWDRSDAEQVAGICVDFSHLEQARLMNKESYLIDLATLEKNKIGCAHISAVANEPFINPKNNQIWYSKHWLDDFSELDYLLGYQTKYFPKIIAIELENSLAEQLKARDYILKLLENC